MKRIIFIFIFTFSLINCVFTQELPNISFDDYMLDKDSLIGKTIKIKGFCRNTINDRFAIYGSGEPFSSSESLDTSNLSREVRKWLLQNCKKGQFITLKAVVKKHDLNVLEIEETK